MLGALYLGAIMTINWFFLSCLTLLLSKLLIRVLPFKISISIICKCDMQIKQERKNKNKNQKKESHSQTIGDWNNFHQQCVNIRQKIIV